LQANRVHNVFTQPFLKDGKRAQPAVQGKRCTCIYLVFAVYLHQNKATKTVMFWRGAVSLISKMCELILKKFSSRWVGRKTVKEYARFLGLTWPKEEVI